MIRTQTLVPALLALLLLGLPLAAQEADEAQTPPAEAAPQSSTPPPREAETVPAASDDSPYDYRSSEEISEDLSVSFPVDI
jgi:hypothetical protein